MHRKEDLADFSRVIRRAIPGDLTQARVISDASRHSPAHPHSDLEPVIVAARGTGTLICGGPCSRQRRDLDLPGQEAFAAQALLRRLLEPGEVAAAVAWLCGPRTGDLTGAVNRVGGGGLSGSHEFLIVSSNRISHWPMILNGWRGY